MTDHWDFDQVIDRTNTGSAKWAPSVLEEKFGQGRGNLMPLWVADMDFACPDVIFNAMAKRLSHRVFGYTLNDGRHNEAVINWFSRRHGWQIAEDSIVNTPGIVPAVHYLIQCFTKPGDGVLIQPPVYYPFAQAIHTNGRHVVENTLALNNDRYDMDFQDLEEKTRDPRVKLAILCSPHNPVGRVWGRGELERFGSICMKNNVLVFADEIHCDLVMPGFKHTSYQSISSELSQVSIAANAASKTFNLAGFGHSCLVIPNEAHRHEMGSFFNGLGIAPMGTSNLFGSIAARAAYEGAEPWLLDLVNYIYGNFLYLKNRIENELPGVRIFNLEATYLPWIDFTPLGLSPQKTVQIVEEKAGLALDHGDWFGRSGAGFERINIACPRQILTKATDALVNAFSPFCNH
ncbi:MalY/PatB family protein [uncultured Desulfobacter sp.]|uniref:MalY/PatB family protein n=1 Tax=uncultured Desulfobacter sp. TaxID=240139 RepID=UPI002AAAC9D5|nr:MalY/PatB family protein [uncultured Desulfobacter sp.]